MMLNRRMASASPGARGSFTKKPSPSGPRWRMAPAIRRTRASASLELFRKATPQIPHTELFYLRGCEKSRSCPRQVLPQMKSRYFKFPVGIPPQYQTQDAQKKCRPRRDDQHEKRFPLEQQAPIERFLPPGKNAVQNPAQPQTFQRQARQSHVRKVLVVVSRRIPGYLSDRFRKYTRVFQIAPCHHLTRSIPQDHPILRINHHPASIHLYFRDHVHCRSIRSQQKEPPRLQIRAPRQIQERVRRCSAHQKQRLKVECI